MIEDFGFTHLYSEDMMYKVHKITRADLALKLTETKTEEEREKIIMNLYDDEAQQGRRGVLKTADAIKVIKKKIEEK